MTTKLDIIKELSYTLKNNSDISTNDMVTFEITCDQFFARDFRNEFLSLGFIVPAVVIGDPNIKDIEDIRKLPIEQVSYYQIPYFGILELHVVDEVKFEMKIKN